MEAKRKSRWVEPPPIKLFTGSDLEICKLLAPSAFAREPWGYQCLPSKYFGPLLGRSQANTARRASELRGKPRYTKLSEQPHNFYRELIFQIDQAGIEQLRDAGFDVKLRSRPVPHELLASCIAASFEIGARQHDLPIVIHPTVKLAAHPDWPLFTLAGRTVFVEADTGSETINPNVDTHVTNIRQKFEHYLQVVKDRVVRKPLFLFITTTPRRSVSFIECLKKVIDTKDFPHQYAECFGFASIKYDRFLNTIPELTPWAITTRYQRAGHDPFVFTEGR
jgi:hypothetical protein